MNSKKNNKQINNNKKNKKKNNKTRRTRRRRIIRIRNNPVRQAAVNAIPMAVPTSYNKYFIMKNMGETAVRVRGCDLIYKIPSNLQTLQNTSLMTIIPANPAYWQGTRIAALAQGYQNYRPMRMTVHYCPTCPVTQQGNVIGGTLWDDIPSADSIQQSLKTSNGGFLTQCYQAASSVIRMKSNLQLNLFRMAGKIDQQSNPFIFMALSIACLNQQNQLINPGVFYIEYDYILKNPIGSSTAYKNTGLTLITQQSSFYTNARLFLAADFQINNVIFPPGTQIDIEYNSNLTRYDYYYHGTPINDDITVPVWVVENQPISTTALIEKHVITHVDFHYAYIQQPTGSFPIPSMTAIGYVHEAENKGIIVFNATSNSINYQAPENGMDIYFTPIQTDDNIDGPIEFYQAALSGLVKCSCGKQDIRFVPLWNKIEQEKFKQADNIKANQMK